MSGQGGGDYNVDVVMCIDATGSMAPIINEVKANALSLYEKFLDAMELQGKMVSELRVKIIAFRDYICDAEPMVESKFFDLPTESEGLEEFVRKIETRGGGDAAECAYEAIAHAMNSEWTTGGKKRRHIIVVFSDAPALPLGERKACPGYPSGLPTDMRELSAWWEGATQAYMSPYQRKAGRLIVFVPQDESWTQLEAWNRFTPAYTSGKGCDDVDMMTVIDTIIGSFDQ